jgi:hypothetical protein
MAKASTGFILTMKGSISAMVAGPPSPGRMPTANPTAIPTNISDNVDQVKICVNPEIKDVNNSNIWSVSLEALKTGMVPGPILLNGARDGKHHL